jgi:hypothetical protein
MISAKEGTEFSAHGVEINICSPKINKETKIDCWSSSPVMRRLRKGRSEIQTMK